MICNSNFILCSWYHLPTLRFLINRYTHLLLSRNVSILHTGWVLPYDFPPTDLFFSTVNNGRMAQLSLLIQVSRFIRDLTVGLHVPIIWLFFPFFLFGHETLTPLQWWMSTGPGCKQMLVFLLGWPLCRTDRPNARTTLLRPLMTLRWGSPMITKNKKSYF